MQVQNWMSRDLICVEETTPLIQVIKILDENSISHLPVLKDGKLTGFITENEVKEASPSKATSMSSRELYRLLAEMEARHIMVPGPVVMSPRDTVEVAAVKMLEHNITGIPVVSDKNELLGIITKGDVFRVMISITGIYQRGVQFAFNLEDRPGSIKEVADIMRQEDCKIVSILSTTDTADEGYRHVFIRISKIPSQSLKRITQRLENAAMLLYVIEDPLQDILASRVPG